MKKVLLFTALGMLLSGGSIVLFFFYLTSLQEGNNLLYLAASLLCLGGGVFCFMRATRQEKPKDTPDTASQDEQLEKMLERNNEIASSWNSTVREQDKLKMLQLASNPDEEKK